MLNEKFEFYTGDNGETYDYIISFRLGDYCTIYLDEKFHINTYTRFLEAFEDSTTTFSNYKYTYMKFKYNNRLYDKTMTIEEIKEKALEIG